MPKKITQNINKDAGLIDLPKVRPIRSKWENKHSNYITSNIGDIVPIYVSEILPSEKKKITMGMISHMTTPIAPIFNAQYTEFRVWWVPHRLTADLLAGYKTRKSPFVKVFGEDNASQNASIIVPLANQTLPFVSGGLISDFQGATFDSFGGIADALDYLPSPGLTGGNATYFIKKLNFLSMAAYELIYQKGYRNENRESATNSDLYKFLFDGYNRASGRTYNDAFHKAQREKDYFTGSQPFTLKAASPVEIGLSGIVDVKVKNNLATDQSTGVVDHISNPGTLEAGKLGDIRAFNSSDQVIGPLQVDLTSANGISIEQLRLYIKTNELLEKDAIWGSSFARSLNAHFGCAPMSDVIDEPLELKKFTVTSQMQAIFQTSTTSGEATILGTIGANSTTQTDEFEILPETEFKEHGYLIICAVHKSQNSYDAQYFKPKHIFKKARFDFYTPELNDLGYQKVEGSEFNATANGNDTAVSYNEAYAEYRFVFNKVHGMFEPSRSGALDYWTLSCSNYNDVQSLYKQDVTELDRALSVKSSVAPQFFDAYGFVEICDKPMSLHSIPGMDGVI